MPPITTNQRVIAARRIPANPADIPTGSRGRVGRVFLGGAFMVRFDHETREIACHRDDVVPEDADSLGSATAAELAARADIVSSGRAAAIANKIETASRWPFASLFALLAGAPDEAARVAYCRHNMDHIMDALRLAAGEPLPNAEIKHLDIRPGGTLVVRFSGRASSDMRHRAEAYFAPCLPEGVNLRVIDSTIDLQVISEPAPC